MVRTLPGAVPVACWTGAVRPDSPAYRTKNVTFMQFVHARLPIWLRPVTAKHANNQGENVHRSNSTTAIVLILNRILPRLIL